MRRWLYTSRLLFGMDEECSSALRRRCGGHENGTPIQSADNNGVCGTPEEADIRVTDSETLDSAAPFKTGVCCSGGGIRAAAYALGCLRSLDQHRALSGAGATRADYLTAVSGGSYAA